MWDMLLWYLRSNTEKQKICLVQVVSENITWNCSCSPQVQVWAWRVQGCWIYAFVTLVPASWKCDFVKQEQLPLMFSAQINSSQSCFPSLFFSYEHLGRFCINFCIPLLFVQNAKKKKKIEIEIEIEIEKGRQEHWRRTPTLFFPFTIFSMYIYEDSLSFFFYPISFC